MRRAEELVLDGNALAGALSQIFVSDVTTARVTCAACADIGSLGAARLYRAAGEVLRCSRCNAVLLRLTTAPDRIYLELTGMRCVELVRPQTSVVE
jgi:hypothetical protein